MIYPNRPIDMQLILHCIGITYVWDMGVASERAPRLRVLRAVKSSSLSPKPHYSGVQGFRG